MTGLTGWPDRAPTNPYGAYTDFIVPRFAIPTIIAALDYRRRTGCGQHIDISQLEASLHFLAPPVVEWAMMGRQAERCGNRHPSAAPHAVYPCRGDDRWCAIACLSEAHWQALCGVMEHPTWSGEEHFATLLARKAHEDALDERVGEWTQGWDAHELMHTLQAAGVPAGVVQTNRDVSRIPSWRTAVTSYIWSIPRSAATPCSAPSSIFPPPTPSTAPPPRSSASTPPRSAATSSGCLTPISPP